MAIRARWDCSTTAFVPVNEFHFTCSSSAFDLGVEDAFFGDDEFDGLRVSLVLRFFGRSVDSIVFPTTILALLWAFNGFRGGVSDFVELLCSLFRSITSSNSSSLLPLSLLLSLPSWVTACSGVAP